MMKRFFCLNVLLLVLVMEKAAASNFIKIKNGDKYGIINEKHELISKIDYSNITLINSYVFLNTGKSIEIRNEKNQTIDIIYPNDCSFFTSVEYLIHDYYLFKGFLKDLIYDLKSKKSFYSKKIAANVFNDKTSYLIPVYTGGYFYSLKNRKNYFSNLSFQKVFPFVDGVAIVLKDNWEKALIDEKGNIILDNIVNSGWQFRNGLLPVITKDCSGFINKKGQFLYKCPIFDEFRNENAGGNPTLWCSFSEGYSYIHTSEDKWILVNQNFEVIKKDLSYSANTRKGFSEGLLPVKWKSKCGYLDVNGELEIPLIFDEAEDFCNGYACVVYNGENAVVDRKGNIYFTKDIISGKGGKSE